MALRLYRGGLASHCDELPDAFKSEINAQHGLCQSCVGILESRQCVNHLDSHTPPAYYYNQGVVITPTLSSSGKEQLQSSVVDTPNLSEDASLTTTNIADFHDEEPGEKWALPTTILSNLSDMQPEIELAKFLSRPVLIVTQTWNQTDTGSFLGGAIQPWHLFFNHAAIKNKINNYSFIHCKLKVKFVINASPFFYGAVAYTYCPLLNLVGDSIATSTDELMLWSQRPKVWVYPQTNQGGEMELPFFYHKNWLDITKANDLRDMGQLNGCLFTNLNSSNGLTGQSVVINIYAWAEDVKLHAPTTKLALQSSEFDYKPSQIASAVAGAASKLSRVPLIGPYMKATSTVSSSISNIASTFGFTNVPNMDKVGFMKNQAYPHNSTCEVSVPTDRSSVDPHNEVCIDPRTVGLDGTDELSVSYICGRETWLGNAIINTTDPVGTCEFSARVTPCLFRKDPSNTGPYLMTPMCYLGTHFGAWRGDIIFRFKFVCTMFHKGRVRIVWDPTNNITATQPDYTTVFNQIVDIGADQDIEVRVPYSQATTYLPVDFNVAQGNYSLTGANLIPTSNANGVITMYIVNPLSAPTATQAISVMVFARAAENFEFAHPMGRFGQSLTMSPYRLQSNTVQYKVDPKQMIVGNEPGGADPNRNLVHYGERIVSLRPLIHRLDHQYSMLSQDIAAANTMTVLSFRQTRQLKYPGFVSNGIYLAVQTLSPFGTVNYNFTRFGFHQLVSLLFIGQRGSITHSINLESKAAGQPCQIQFKRHNATIGTGDYNARVLTTSGTNSGIADFISRNIGIPGNGVALTDANIQPGMIMNFPYYSRYNFQFVTPSTANTGSAIDDSNTDIVAADLIFEKIPSTNSVRVNIWSAYGPDYNFFFFRNVPSIWIYNQPSAP